MTCAVVNVRQPEYMCIVLSKISYSISTEQENKADNLLKDGLHLLMAALTNGGQCHQPSMAVFPVHWRQTQDSLTLLTTETKSVQKVYFLTVLQHLHDVLFDHG